MVFAICQHESAMGPCVPSWTSLPSPSLPNPIPLGCPRALALSALLHASNLHWSSILHMVTYMFLEREMGEYPLQYSCLENPMDRGACKATVYGVARGDTTQQLNHHHHDQYTCFNAILSNPPTLAFSHRVQKSVLYICDSSAALHIGVSFSSFYFPYKCINIQYWCFDYSSYCV